MTGIEPHILRYWEKEFSLLHPKKNSGGKRAYKEKDIESIVEIKRLLEEEKYTLQGAKSKLLDERRERRTGCSAASPMKRRKTDTADGGDGSDLTDSSAAEPEAAPTPSIPAAAADKPARRKSGPKNNNGHGVNNDDEGDDRCNGTGNDDALILNIRDELREVLGLLES